MEYITINIGERNDGNAYFAEDVFEDIASITVNRFANTVSLADKKATVAKIKKGTITISINLKVKRGIDIVSTCEKLQTKIHDDILEMTGIDCNNIFLDITGFLNEKDK